MEATPGFEPGNKGFAGLCLTTWLCRRKRNFLLQQNIFYHGKNDMSTGIFPLILYGK
jgi:hypothetical protein